MRSSSRVRDQTRKALYEAVNQTLGSIGTTIFTVMSALAVQHGSINLGQGFPDTTARPTCCRQRRMR